MDTIFYIILAALGLSFLVFIHELGHYIVARRVGMRVEVFSIGFGKPLLSWNRKGVRWQIGLLPFGGYVKIAGMSKENHKEPHEIPDGFFGKKPGARIKVALAGPIVNIVFALLIFTAIWATGGRQKPFAEFTKIIGWVDPNSDLYKEGIRPGDEILSYNGESFQGYKDLIYASVTQGETTEISGNKIDYLDGEKSAFHLKLNSYDDPNALEQGMKTVGVVAPASYLIYHAPKAGLLPGSPMEKSGIQDLDRIVWVDGELIFSHNQLSHLLNENKVLLTVKRGDKTFHARVPRLQTRDLRQGRDVRVELQDWQHEAGIEGRIEDLYTIPYELSYTLAVEKPLTYIDDQSKEANQGNSGPLRVGDRILAVDGNPVFSVYRFLDSLQSRRVQVIVKRNGVSDGITWTDEDRVFEQGTHWQELTPILQRLGSALPLKESGQFHLLNPSVPVHFKDLPMLKEEKKTFMSALIREKERIQQISDQTERNAALEAINRIENRYVLGVDLRDQRVEYNPNPIVMFSNIVGDISRTFTKMVSGDLSPKWLAGPVGIVRVMQQSWGIGVKEALFWLGAISLNLGLLNLLPLPVLDGGHICFSVIESVRKKPLKAKTMERLIIPFVALLILFFIFVTYHDLSRILHRFF